MPARPPLVIIGAGGHGREVAQVVRALNNSLPSFELLGVLDDDPACAERLAVVGLRYLGETARVAEIDAQYVIGIGVGRTRQSIAALLDTHQREAAVVVHPQASIGDDVTLGPGTFVNAGGRVTTYASLGRHVHLNTNATVAHDSRLDDYVTVSPGANLAGTCHLGEGVMIGTNATVLPNRTIGAWSVVGAGAVVTRDVDAGVTVMGSPARPR